MAINFTKGQSPSRAMGLGKAVEIDKFFSALGISKSDYVIDENNDFSIYFKGDLDLVNKNLTGLPTFLSKAEVEENFWCDGNKLTSLVNCPREVGGSFSCTNNPLESKDGGPDHVVGNSWK